MNDNGGRDYPGDGEFAAAGPDQNGEDGDYGQLLYRPGEGPPRPPRFRPGRGRPRQPGQPGAAGPASGPFPNGPFPNGPAAGGSGARYPNGGPASRGPGPASRGPGAGGPGHPVPGYEGTTYERPGRPGPRPGYGPPGPRPRWTPGPAYPPGQRSDDFDAGADWQRMPPGPGRQYLESNGRPIPPRADRLFRNPVPPGAYRTAGPAGPGAPGNGMGGRPGAGAGAGMPGPGMPGSGVPGSAMPGPGRPGPGMPGGQGMPGAGMPRQGGPGYGPGPGGFRERVGPQQRPRPRPRPRPPGGQYRGGVQAGQPAGPGPAGSLAPAEHVIRQRDNALPEGSLTTGTQPIAAIAPDALDSFARDLRALRAKAELDYEEMAERSHYTMKTLASAAGGLRLPTLPVAVAYVRACDGDVAEWEDRWHKLAEKITAQAAKNQADGEAPQEPAEASEAVPAQPAAQQQPPPDGQSAVYVITSAKPRQPDW